MKIKDLLIGFALTVLAAAVLCGLFWGGSLIYKSISENERIQNTFPTGSPIVLKNLDIKGNVAGYTGNNTVNILVIDKIGQSHTITVEMSLLTKP